MSHMLIAVHVLPVQSWHANRFALYPNTLASILWDLSHSSSAHRRRRRLSAWNIEIPHKSARQSTLAPDFLLYRLKVEELFVRIRLIALLDRPQGVGRWQLGNKFVPCSRVNYAISGH